MNYASSILGLLPGGRRAPGIGQLVSKIEAYLPPDQVDEIAATALRAAAHAAIRRGHRMISHGEMRVPLVNMREAVLCSRAPSVLARLPLLAAHWLVAGALSIVRGR